MVITASAFTVSVISIVAYLPLLVVFKHRIVQQQAAFVVVFLTGVAVVGELDDLLPIYFVVSFLPFIPKLRKLSLFSAALLLYLFIYLMIGLLLQNPTRTLVTFIAKMWQFAVFFIIYDEDILIGDSDFKPIFISTIIVETVLGIYLLYTSTMVDSLSGLVRLVNNGQPITGNFATVVLPISTYYYITNRKNSRKTRFLLLSNLYYLVWIILSGTRGYMMEYAFVMGIIIYDYFTNARVGQTTRRNRLFLIITIVAVGIILTVAVPGLIERTFTITRLKSSGGIRSFENAATWDFIKRAPLHELTFGIGFGGTAAKHETLATALYKQFSLGMWNRNYYLFESGALFHSLYANIVMCMGLIGIFVTILIFFNMWKRVTLSCKGNVLARRIMHLFQISFFIMNYYRWSADCGISEMIAFALVLKLIRAQTNNSLLDS